MLHNTDTNMALAITRRLFNDLLKVGEGRGNALLARILRYAVIKMTKDNVAITMYGMAVTSKTKNVPSAAESELLLRMVQEP